MLGDPIEFLASDDQTSRTPRSPLYGAEPHVSGGALATTVPDIRRTSRRSPKKAKRTPSHPVVSRCPPDICLTRQDRSERCAPGAGPGARSVHGMPRALRLLRQGSRAMPVGLARWLALEEAVGALAENARRSPWRRFSFRPAAISKHEQPDSSLDPLVQVVADNDDIDAQRELEVREALPKAE